MAWAGSLGVARQDRVNGWTTSIIDDTLKELAKLSGP